MRSETGEEMNKTYKNIYYSSGATHTVTVIKRHNTRRYSKIRNALDFYFCERLQEFGKCSYCLNHDDSNICNCRLRYCTIVCDSSNRSPGSDLSDLTPDKPKDPKPCGSSNTAPQKVSNSFPSKSTDKKDRSDSLTENLDESHSSLEEIHNVSQENQIPGNSSGSVRAPSTGSKCVCEIPGVGDTLNCTHQKNKTESMKVENTDTSRTTEEEKMPVARENKFHVGETLEVQCLGWEKEGYCWVRLVENYPLFKRIQAVLNKNPEILPVVRPSINELFLFEYERSWYRGKIISMEPELLVRCVDTGVKFSPRRLECKVLDPKIAAIEDLAFQVIVSEETMPEELICGRMRIEISGLRMRAVYEIKIVGGGIRTISNEGPRLKFMKKIKSCRSNVFEDLQEGMCGLFRSTHVDNKEMLGCLVPDDIEDAVTSFRHVNDLCCLEDQEKEVEIGDFVMVGHDKDRGLRGVIKSKSKEYGYEVVLLDYGYTVFSKNIYNLPKVALGLMDLACKITVTFKIPGSFSLLPDTNYYFEVKEKLNEGRWVCFLKKEFESQGFQCKATLERADESLHKIDYIPFEPGCVVIVSALSRIGTDNHVYIRRVDKDYEKRFQKLCNNIENLPQNADKDFLDNISSGDLVAAKYKDGCYFRAKIVFRNGRSVCVFFLDLGCEQFAKLYQLKPLPHKFIEEPVYARKVSLIGPKDHITNKGISYLDNLLKSGQKLILKYNHDIIDGVILVEQGVPPKVNPRDSRTLQSQRSKLFDGVTENFFRECKFSTGVIQNFVILYVGKEEFAERGVFWAANPNNSYCNKSLQEVSEELGKHCQSDKREYLPLSGELCFGFYEGDWYRAFAVDASGRSVEVFFVDYGNTSFLEPSSIREKKLEFFKIPPVAMKCVLEGFDDFEKEDIEAAHAYLLRKINSFAENVEIVEVNDDGCVVLIPELYDEIYGKADNQQISADN